MSSIEQITDQIIKRSPFLIEAISDDIVNLPSLARSIQPEIERALGKEVKSASIIFVLKRLSTEKYYPFDIESSMQKLDNFSIQSNLESVSFRNPGNLYKKQEFIDITNSADGIFHINYLGLQEHTIITSRETSSKIIDLLASGQLTTRVPNLASITMKFNQSVQIEGYGICYLIIKHLAIEGVEVVNLNSSASEFSIFMHNMHVNKAFKILMQLKSRKPAHLSSDLRATYLL